MSRPRPVGDSSIPGNIHARSGCSNRTPPCRAGSGCTRREGSPLRAGSSRYSQNPRQLTPGFPPISTVSCAITLVSVLFRINTSIEDRGCLIGRELKGCYGLLAAHICFHRGIVANIKPGRDAESEGGITAAGNRPHLQLNIESGNVRPGKEEGVWRYHGGLERPHVLSQGEICHMQDTSNRLFFVGH